MSTSAADSHTANRSQKQPPTLTIADLAHSTPRLAAQPSTPTARLIGSSVRPKDGHVEPSDATQIDWQPDNLPELVHLVADGRIPASPRHRKLARRLRTVDPTSAQYWNGILCLHKLGLGSGSFGMSYFAPSKMAEIEHAKERDRLTGGGRRVKPKPTCKAYADGKELTRSEQGQFRRALRTPLGLKEKPSAEPKAPPSQDERNWRVDVDYSSPGPPPERLYIRWVPEGSDYITPSERELVRIKHCLEDGMKAPEIAKKMRLSLRTTQRRIDYLLSWPNVADENGAECVEMPSIVGQEVSDDCQANSSR